MPTACVVFYPHRMKRISIFLALLCSCVSLHAQLSRRALEKMATEAVKQYCITGRMPADSLTDRMAEASDTGLELIVKMADPDDVRQQKGCLALALHIVEYCTKPAGQRYVDVVRNGLKKAIDRSDDPDTQTALTEALATCAKPADVPHFAMYLGMPHTAPAAYAALVAMPGIDGRLQALANASTPPDANIEKVLKARAGQPVAAPAAVKARAKATPFWTASLDRAVDGLRDVPAPRADSIVAAHPNAGDALPLLLADAERRQGADRDAVLARYVLMAADCPCTPEERYLVLRAADELQPCADLRRKIIVMMGGTHTLQALAYIRQYYDRADMADASAVATRDIIRHAPQLNGGRYVRNMLNAAKHAFIPHYDEEGADTAIDDVLDALDHCPADGGYNLAYGAPTRMGKRGYWNMYGEMTDFDMAFDWSAQGTLTVALHALPLVVIDSKQGARAGSNGSWHGIGNLSPWRTAHIHVHGGKYSVSVNGHDICTGAPLPDATHAQGDGAKGTVSFNADELGATVRQVCIRKGH